MGLLVTEVTRIVEKIYVITCIRPGRYKLFPQLVISFSLTSLDFVRSGDQPKRNWDHLTKIRQCGWAYSHDFTAAILVFQANPVRVGLFVCKKFSCSHKFAWCWPREWIRSILKMSSLNVICEQLTKSIDMQSRLIAFEVRERNP